MPARRQERAFRIGEFLVRERSRLLARVWRRACLLSELARFSDERGHARARDAWVAALRHVMRQDPGGVRVVGVGPGHVALRYRHHPVLRKPGIRLFRTGSEAVAPPDFAWGFARPNHMDPPQARR